MEGGQLEDCCGQIKGNCKRQRRIGGSRDFECAHDSGCGYSPTVKASPRMKDNFNL